MINNNLPHPKGGPEHDALEKAPRDGTMIWLLVDYTVDANAAEVAKTEAEGYVWDGYPLVDADRGWTIGFNNRDNDGEDRWQFVGWCWSHDHFTQGHGTPVAWRPVGFDLEAG